MKSDQHTQVADREKAAEVDDRGMATAEYAIVMLAAAAFAGLLMLVLRSDTVREMLTSIVQQALTL